jgi:hypothetical protein
MAADVQEGPDAVVGSQHEHRDLARPGREPVSDALDPACVAHVLPGAAEDPLLFAAQHLWL